MDFEKHDLPAGKLFDVCIVGAGAAGLTLAHEMLRLGHSVLLLEGGGQSRWERKSQAINKSHILGHAFHGAHSGRFRGLGGTTAAWAGHVMDFAANGIAKITPDPDLNTDKIVANAPTRFTTVVERGWQFGAKTAWSTPICGSIKWRTLTCVALRCFRVPG